MVRVGCGFSYVIIWRLNNSMSESAGWRKEGSSSSSEIYMAVSCHHPRNTVKANAYSDSVDKGEQSLVDIQQTTFRSDRQRDCCPSAICRPPPSSMSSLWPTPLAFMVSDMKQCASLGIDNVRRDRRCWVAESLTLSC